MDLTVPAAAFKRWNTSLQSVVPGAAASKELSETEVPGPPPDLPTRNSRSKASETLQVGPMHFRVEKKGPGFLLHQHRLSRLATGHVFTQPTGIAIR